VIDHENQWMGQMRNRKSRRVTARYQWDRLKVSFWFAPVVMSLASILLAWLMYRLDVHIPNEALQSSRLVLSGSPVELRSMLIGMATTILTTAGVVFTLLTLPLSTVAAQYGSRLLRVFLGDRTTQLVLGMFVATFVYCLAAALSIPPLEVEPDGPQLTATVGLVLMLGTFASIILLIQHISTMLQAPNIAAAAGAELRDVVLVEIPETVRKDTGNQTSQDAQKDLAEAEAFRVRVEETGYIEFVDPETVFSLARESNLVIRLLRKPGHFVRRNEVVALVWPASRVDEQLAGQIRRVFRLGNTRTPTQDIVYAVNQLVEMAVRAMSPAINDPFTAMTCLEYIGEGLVLFIQQGERDPCYYDQDGRLHLVFEPVTCKELFNAAFDMLRHASSDNASVLSSMLEVIDKIGQEAKSTETRQELSYHVSLIQAESQVGNLINQDRQMIHHLSESINIRLSSTAYEGGL
jgi:uncharacterized membrane protein